MKNIYKIEGKTQYKTDVSVLMVFFCRPDVLKIAFEEIRKAKPSKIYLAQD